MKRFVAGLILLFAVGCSVPLYGAALSVTWDPPTTNTDGTELDPANLRYNLYRGPEVGPWELVMTDVEGEAYTFIGLNEGQLYRFTVSAKYQGWTNESAYADELVYIVPDLTAPVLVVPTLLTVRLTPVGTEIPCPDLLAGAEASDNVTPANEIVLTQLPAAGTMLAAGTHVIVVTAMDNGGNVATAESTVVVLVPAWPTKPLNLRVVQE